MIHRKIKDDDIKEVSLIIINNLEIMRKYHSKEIIDKFISHNTAENLRKQMSWKDILVVEKNKEIIATGAIANFGEKQIPKYCISNFFVKPELHRKGIGKTLFNELKKLAKAKGAKVLHVPSSRNAVGFYSSMSFKIDNLQPDTKDEITWMSAKLN